MRDLSCGEVQEVLPVYADQPGRNLSVRRHLASCDECRRDLAHYEELRTGLRALADRPLEPSADLLPALMAIPDSDNAVVAVTTHVKRNRLAYLGGAAVLVAGAAGAAVWRSRRRLAPA